MSIDLTWVPFFYLNSWAIAWMIGRFLPEHYDNEN